MQVILASQSPRRKELMGLFHIPFTVRVADIDETMDPNQPASQEVARVSRAKAEAVACKPGDVVIAADTIVVCDGQILGKPADRADAYRMLRLLSGRDHQVMTGLTVLRYGKAEVCTEITDIHFRELTDREIHNYIATGEPMDKAGAYAIQGGAGAFIEGFDGSFENVVGFPVDVVRDMLKQFGF